MKIPLAKPFFTEEELDEVSKTLQSGWVAQGPRVTNFEQIVAEYSGAMYGIAVNSCTSALHLSLLAHGIGPADKVIIPDFTYTATGNVVLHVGATPVIVDIDPFTLCMDVAQIEDKIDNAVKAIIPVHAFGYPAAINTINEIAAEHGLVVIEDAALAIGSEMGGKKIGSFGNTTCFSLQGRKVVTTGEGGMVLTSDDGIAEKIQALRSQGGFTQKPKPEKLNLPLFKMVGLSYRLSDIQAAIGIVQMRRLDEFIHKRRQLAHCYNDSILDFGLEIQTPDISKNIKQNFQTYAVILKNGERDRVVNDLKKKGVESTIGTYSLSAQPLFLRKEKFPNSKYAFERSLALPMYHELSEEKIKYIVEFLKQIY